jgi:hypothetical protein
MKEACERYYNLTACAGCVRCVLKRIEYRECKLQNLGRFIAPLRTP